MIEKYRDLKRELKRILNYKENMIENMIEVCNVNISVMGTKASCFLAINDQGRVARSMVSANPG